MSIQRHVRLGLLSIRNVLSAFKIKACCFEILNLFVMASFLMCRRLLSVIVLTDTCIYIHGAVGRGDG